jgi:hypothetical protein
MTSNHNGMAMAKEGWERDTYHEASPLHDMKMPKIEAQLHLSSHKNTTNIIYIKNLPCNKLIMKIMRSLFIHGFVHFTHEYHALKTHLTHG